jgi:hypothetical protein
VPLNPDGLHNILFVKKWINYRGKGNYLGTYMTFLVQEAMKILKKETMGDLTTNISDKP